MRSRSIAPKSPRDCQILCLVDSRTRSQPTIPGKLERNKCAARFDRRYTSRYYRSAGWSSPVARWAHNPKVVGSNPTPATKLLSDDPLPEAVFLYYGFLGSTGRPKAALLLARNSTAVSRGLLRRIVIQVLAEPA